MSIQTNLNVSPYFDDYDPDKKYYRVLFKPSAAVQVRELNQLQTILQNQIEKFGDNIFQRGTIIEGCNIILHNNLPYVKIKDVEVDGTPVNITQYDNLYVRNAANVSAYIVRTVAGYESRSPDLNTLFVKYNASGNDGITSTFSASETLTVYSPAYPVFKYKVVDGSSNFSNSDTLSVVSAIAVTNSTGGNTFPANAFKVNDVIQNGVANAVIIEANTTANTSALILRIKPLAADVLTANNAKWRFSSGETIRNASNNVNVANISYLVGTGASGSIVTDSLGKILSVGVTNQGSGYVVPPHVTVSITSGGTTTTSQVNQLDITGQNFLTNITVANSAQLSIGTGYGISVDEGTIYQKGFFSKVESQLAIVNKYSNTGFTKSVGFYTEEAIINSNQDTSLNDNSLGSTNFTAPGADRLQLNPVLNVLEKSDADANTDFLPVVEFADGEPYKQKPQTVYNVIGDEIAKRTFEESGNYVLDRFNLVTKDSPTFPQTPSVFKIYVDPGIAYIKGYRVETQTSYAANVAKGTDYLTNQAATLRVGYGNYVRVKELGGVFEFNTGAQVELYDATATYLSTNAGSAITASGNKIGDARMRSIVLESGEPGTPSAVYQLYLFDINMSAGKNFANTRSVYYAGSTKGIADTVVDGSNTTILVDSKDSSLLFKSINALRSANNITYTYRTIKQDASANTTGFISISLSAGEYFPYTTGSNLLTSEERELIIFPRSNYQALANAPGSVSVSTSSNVVTGTSTSFPSNFSPGDYIKIANSTASVVKQISQITNTTSIILSSNAGVTMTGNAVLYFPNNVPITLSTSTNRFANVNGTGQTLIIGLGNSIANSSGSASSANVTVVYNVTANNTAAGSKTSLRDRYVRIRAANNAANTEGPWALGVPDVYRLKKVYQANGASRALSVNANTGVQNSGTTNAFILSTNNPFANGDSVVYSNTGATSVITGLTNATTYYVVYANNSGFALASTRNGANLSLTASSVSENHTFTGSPLYFTDSTFGVADVTNEYYVDHNQNEDFLNTSYLYRKPRQADISNNDVLLVKYDVFTTGSGVKTVSSYPINDTANLASLSAGSDVNTMEIPEIIGTSGTYYDLRDQFDFRPVSQNTVPIISEISNTSIVNPPELTAANRITASEKKFPVPNSTLTANISYYIGRNDRVILDKNSNFTILRGTPGVLDAFPPEPSDCITIQYLRIPPYPSLPTALSSEMIDIVDTKVANEKYGRRKDNFKVSTPIDKNQVSRIQVKNYQMSDIASIERRVKDLEYYVSFTLAESIAQSKFIPSSTDSTMDRFKFGFFVDPYTDYSFSDTQNPEFWTTINNNRLSPKIVEFNLEMVPENTNSRIVTLPYTEYTLITQNDATDGPLGVGASSNTGVSTNNVSQSIATVQQKQKTYAMSDSGTVYEDFYYTFSTLAGPASFYLSGQGNPIAVQISQSITPDGNWSDVITSAGAARITTADADQLGLRSLNTGDGVLLGLDNDTGNWYRTTASPFGGYIVNQQKLLWTHNPANGVYYRVRIYKANHVGKKGRGTDGAYEYRMYYPADTVTNSTVTVTTPSSFKFNGVVGSVDPPSFTLITTGILTNIVVFDYVYGDPQYSLYVADAQRFRISVSGLKPSSYHEFVFNGEDKTSSCTQQRTSTTNTTGLLTDENGTIVFDFYYDAGISEASSDLAQANKIASALAGVKSFTIQTTDGSSIAKGIIDMKHYTNIDEQTTISTQQTVNVLPTQPTIVSVVTNDYNYKLEEVPAESGSGGARPLDYFRVDLV